VGKKALVREGTQGRKMNGEERPKIQRGAWEGSSVWGLTHDEWSEIVGLLVRRTLGLASDAGRRKEQRKSDGAGTCTVSQLYRLQGRLRFSGWLNQVGPHRS